MTPRALPLIVLLGLSVLKGSASDVEPNMHTTVAAGTPGGYYQKVCSAMHDVALQHSIDIGCITSYGSQENVYDLEQNKAEFAMVQSDVAHRAWKGEYPFDEKHEGNIRLVMPLFAEKVHILVRPHQYLSSLSQLKGKHVWIGAKTSGSRLSAFTLLRAAGLERSDLRAMLVNSLDTSKALALLRVTAKDNTAHPLDAVIDRLPEGDSVSTMLASLGIKEQPLSAPGGARAATAFLRPDLAIDGPHDWRGLKVWIDKNCCQHQAKILNLLDIVPSNAANVAEAFNQLRKKNIDALIESEPPSRAMVCAILQAHGYTALPLAPDPRAGGKKDLMIFLRRGLSITSPVQLVGKKVWWPDHQSLDSVVLPALVPSESGADVQARRQAIEVGQEINAAMAFDLLASGQLDAVFQTAVPNPHIRELLNRKSEIGLLGLEWPMVEKLVADGSYIETSLQPADYPSLQQGQYTVAVQTLLLTRLGVTGEDAKKVAIIAGFLHNEQRPIEDHLREIISRSNQDQPGEPYVLPLIRSPLKAALLDVVHDSAAKFLVTSTLRPDVTLELCFLGLGVFGVTAAALLLERGRRFASSHAPKFLFAIACGLVWTIGAIYLQALEGDLNQDFTSLPSAGFSLARTVIGHFGLPTTPPEPTTRTGRHVMEIFSWLGVLLFGGFFVPLLKSLKNSYFDPKLKSWSAPPPPTITEEASKKAAA